MIGTLGGVACSTLCLVATYPWSLEQQTLSAGVNNSGPFTFNVTVTGIGQSNIGSISVVSHDTGITRDFVLLNQTGNMLISNINGSAADSLYGSYTGQVNTTSLTSRFTGTIDGGTGRYAGAIGSLTFNNTGISPAQRLSSTLVRVNGTQLLIAAILLP